MHEAHYWMILYFTFYILLKTNGFGWNFQKWSSHGFETNYGVFNRFEQKLLESAQHIMIEWSFSYNLISCSKMMGFGYNF